MVMKGASSFPMPGNAYERWEACHIQCGPWNIEVHLLGSYGTTISITGMARARGRH